MSLVSAIISQEDAFCPAAGLGKGLLGRENGDDARGTLIFSTSEQQTITNMQCKVLEKILSSAVSVDMETGLFTERPQLDPLLVRNQEANWS